MTVLFDVRSELLRTASAATNTWPHTATAANVIGAVVSFMRAPSVVDTIFSVSYGGVLCTRVNRAVDATTEPGAVEWWVTTGVPPSGTQNVAYSSSAPASNIFATALTFTGAGSLYAIGSQIKEVDNTASHSMSLTTGYVVGYGMEAVYWGGSSPQSLTFGVDYTIAGGNDFGAFGVRAVRYTDPTTAGTGPLVPVGVQQPGSDDLAAAAIFVTDGGIAPEVGSAVVGGLQPTIIDQTPAGEATRSPGAGLALTSGLGPTVSGYVFPEVGLAQAVGQIPVVGGFVFPGVGAIATAGQIPEETRELYQPVGVGSAVLAGQVPETLRDGAQGPGVGSAILGSLAPTLYTELNVTPDVGLALLEGRGPTVSSDAQPGTEATALPEVGLVTIAGLAPTLAVEYDKPRGHVRTRDYGRHYTLSAEPAVDLLAPPPAITVVQANYRDGGVLKIDTTATEYALAKLKRDRARIERMRREEEELISILMRAA